MPKFLGISEEGELLDDGSWKLWTVTRRFIKPKFFNPWQKHLRGRPIGIVDDSATQVPFVSVDIDRHNQEPWEEHLGRIKAVIGILPKSLRWLIDINPVNGSLKFFGFKFKPILIDEARAIAESIHKSLGFNLEVFPFNSHAVWLPCRPEKITLGIEKEIVIRKVNGKMEKIETYSLESLKTWIRSGNSVDFSKVFVELNKIRVQGIDPCLLALSQLRCDTADAGVSPLVAMEQQRPKTRKSIRSIATGCNTTGYNALTAQFDALLKYSRQLKAIPDVDHALNYLRQEGIFSGDWAEGLRRRTVRVGQILNHIANTFDAKLCTSEGFSISIGQFKKYADDNRRLFISNKLTANKYGEVVNGKTVKASPEWVSVALSLIDYCGRIDPNEDGTIPTKRIKNIWNSLHKAGKISVGWCGKKWKIVRDTLHNQGLIWTNKIWSTGKAMVWKLSIFFFPSVGKKEYKEEVKKPTTLNDLLRLIDCRLSSSIHNSLIETENKEKGLEGEKEEKEIIRPPTG